MQWPFHAATVSTSVLTLDHDGAGELVWWMSPEETAQIAPGTYTITGALDSLGVQPPFANMEAVRAVPVTLSVLSAVQAPSADVEARRRLLVADYHLLTGAVEPAVGEVDALLAADPRHTAGLYYKAALAHREGDLNAAVEAYSRALAAFYESNPEAQEPPVRLLGEAHALLDEIESQTSFEVTVAPKVAPHPYTGLGSEDGYRINALPGADLWLRRGVTYTFKMVNVPADTPFYLSTSPVGNGAAPFEDGVVGSPAIGNDSLVFTPGESAPDVLYYQSTNREYMGWRLWIGDAVVVGIESDETGDAALPVNYDLSVAYPNPFNPTTRFTLVVNEEQRVTAGVYDVNGRRLAVLFDERVPAGRTYTFALDGQRLASGVYVVRVEGERFAASRKVVLAK